jgi:hypothetical protein
MKGAVSLETIAAIIARKRSLRIRVPGDWSYIQRHSQYSDRSASGRQKDNNRSSILFARLVLNQYGR